MPIHSQFTDAQIEEIMLELITVLEKNKASAKLSLVVLGNLLTHILNSQIPPGQREKITNSFCNALIKSIVIESAH